VINGGFVTPDKKIVIDCIYDDASPFTEGVAAVLLNEKFGYIDKNGTNITAFIYDDIYPGFYEGFAAVSIDEKWGFIDLHGKI